jgi:acetyltransferase-like isoleucine patch superfamily enzyme
VASLRSQANGLIPASTQFDGAVSAIGTGQLSLGNHCRLGRGVEFDTSLAGHIRVGARVRINSGTIIVSNSRVVIGDDTLIGEYVSIRDANHGVAAGSLIRTQPQTISEINIGRDVWIGRGCCILKGVSVGDGAVIGANSVVTRDVPPGHIYAGAPARRIGQRKQRSETTHAG